MRTLDRDYWQESLGYWLDAEDEWASDYNERRGLPSYGLQPCALSAAECLQLAKRARLQRERCVWMLQRFHGGYEGD